MIPFFQRYIAAELGCIIDVVNICLLVIGGDLRIVYGEVIRVSFYDRKDLQAVMPAAVIQIATQIGRASCRERV